MYNQIINLPKIEKIGSLYVYDKDIFFHRESINATNLTIETFLEENNLFYFYIDNYKNKNLNFFLNKTVSIFIEEKNIRVVGEFQKMLKTELSLFFAKKREEIIDSLGFGEFLVFIPEQWQCFTNNV